MDPRKVMAKQSNMKVKLSIFAREQTLLQNVDTDKRESIEDITTVLEDQGANSELFDQEDAAEEIGENDSLLSRDEDSNGDLASEGPIR